MKNVVLLFLLVLTLFSCKKDTTPTPNNGVNTPTATETMLTQEGVWKIQRWIVSPYYIPEGDTKNIIDMKSYYAACITDNGLIFKSNGVLVEDEGTLKCNANGNQQNQFAWSVNTNETKISMKGKEYFIEKISNDTLVLNYYELMPAQSMTFNIIYTRVK